MAFTNLDSLQRREEMNNRLRASANRLNPFFGQQQPQLYTSIPRGGFMGQNQIGGQSSINVFRKPPPDVPFGGQSPLRPAPDVPFGGQSPLRPKPASLMTSEEREKQYQQGAAEFQLSQREAELEELRRNRIIQEGKDRNAAHQIKNRYYMLDGEPVSAEEMKAASGKYLREYTTPPEVTPEQERTNSIRKSLRQFQQNPMQFLLGGGQNVGELLNYLNTANQLFKATGQEGNFMDSLFGSLQKSQGNVPRQSLQNKNDVRAAQRQDLLRREEEKRKSRSYQPSDYRTFLTPFIIRDAPIAPQTPLPSSFRTPGTVGARPAPSSFKV